MNNNFEFITNLQYENKKLRAQVKSFRNGEKYAEMSERIRLVTKEKSMIINQLKKELSAANSALVTMREKWSQVSEDIESEHKKALAEKDRIIKKLENRALTAERSSAEVKDRLREKSRQLYEALAALEEERGKNQKLKAQLSRDYENSSVPSSMKPNRKKIANSREKTGRKPGGQPGHKGHPRKKHIPTNQIFIPAPEEFLDILKYKPTGKMISKQVINLKINLVVDEYITPEYRNISFRQRVHAAFPDGVVNEVHYGGGVKAFAYLLNNHCMVSVDKVRDFLSEITNGELKISKGMINGLSKEFSGKTEAEQKRIFSDLLRGPVMNTDFSVVKVNGVNTHVAVCANPKNVMYFARNHKGHDGVKATPVENYQGNLVHDHDLTFYTYGNGHQECLAHVLRYLKSSMENEPALKWNIKMWDLIREMIHHRNSLPEDATVDFGEAEKYKSRYMEILNIAKYEYEYEPPGKYFRDGYNLYRRLEKYTDSHLLFLYDTNVPATNNLSERLLRVLKRKSKQVMTFRSFESFEYLCNCMGVIASLRNQKENLYKSVASIFDGTSAMTG